MEEILNDKTKYEEGSHQGPTFFKDGMTSVFDRLGKKLTEYDLMTKLERINAEKIEKRPANQAHESERPPFNAKSRFSPSWP